MKNISLTLLFLFIYATALTQKKDSLIFNCGDSQYIKYLEKKSPEFYRAYKDKVENLISANNSGISLDTTTVYTIPVIFRIYHLGEPVGVGSNLSESRIKMAINSLNDIFRGVGRFEGLTVDVKIQFVLASRKLDGSATNGIERIDGRIVAGYEANGLTSYNTTPFEVLGQNWGSNYYKIHVYHNMTLGGTAGFSSYNVTYQHVVSFRNFDPGQLLAHEAGHSLGLRHTFEGDGDNQYCPVNNNPDIDGDGISDTDPHKKITSNDSSAINPCTGLSLGRVIYNIMSYSQLSKNSFTQKQREKMRYNLVNLQSDLLNSPALLPPNINSPILTPACTVANTIGQKGFPSLTFKLNNLLYSDFSGSTRYIDYSTFYPTEPLVAGQSYTFSIQPRYRSDNGAIRLYIDFNNDGDFDDTNENPVSYNGNIPTTTSSFTIIIPTNTITYTNIRMRFLYDSEASSINSCTLPDRIGNVMVAADFSVKIFSNCGTTILPPTVTSITVPSGQSGTVQASNCTGTIKWYDIDQNYIQSGNSLTINNIQRVYNYYATCTIGRCESTNSTKVSITPTYTIVLNSVPSLCANNATSIAFTHNFPTDTYFTLVLLKAGKITNYTYKSDLFNSNPYNFTLPVKLQYGTDYSLKIITGQTQSNNIENITIGNLSNSNGYTTFIDSENDYLGGYHYLCTGTSKRMLGKLVKNSTSNIRTEITEGVVYQWKKDGANYGTNLNPIIASQAGNYQLQATQGGCTLNSSSVYLNFTSNPNVYIVNQPSVLNVCDGITYNIYPNYNSTSATFQWKKNGTAIPGATTRILPTTTSGLYSVNIVDGVCNSQTSEVKLNFGTSLKPQLYYQDTLLCNTYAFLSENMLGNIGAFNYQWQKDGINILDATQSYYYASTPGLYKVIMSQGNCSAHSKNVTVINATQKQKPILSTYGNTNICYGSIATSFNNNYCTLFKDDIPIYTGYNYTLTQSGIYKLKTFPTDNSCSNQSDSIVISIGTNLIPIIKQDKSYYTNYSPKSLPILCGSNDFVSLSFSTTETGVYSYQWQKNGIDIIGSTYNYIWVWTPGDYRLQVTNGTCTEYSNVITVVRGNGTNAKIVSDDNNLECSNRLAQLELVDGHSSNINWFRNGILIPNENNTKLFVNSDGDYTVNFNDNSGCAATSPPITIHSKFISKPFTSPTSILIGQNATLVATGCTGSITWYDSIRDGKLIGLGSQFITPTLNSSTFYFPECSINGCNSSRTPTLVTVNPCLTLYSIVSGNWNTTTTWSCGRTPTITDDVTISAGHTITIPAGQTGFVNKLTQNGNLSISSLGALKIKTQ